MKQPLKQKIPDSIAQQFMNLTTDPGIDINPIFNRNICAIIIAYAGATKTVARNARLAVATYAGIAHAQLTTCHYKLHVEHGEFYKILVVYAVG